MFMEEKVPRSIHSLQLEHRQADNLPSHRGRRQSALIFTPRMVPGMLYPTKHALSTCGTPASCGGKRVLEALNSSSVCYVTVLVYIPYILFSYSPYTGGHIILTRTRGNFREQVPGVHPEYTPYQAGLLSFLELWPGTPVYAAAFHLDG